MSISSVFYFVFKSIRIQLFAFTNKKTAERNNLSAAFSDPGGTRTPNRQNRNLLFYPLNYGAKCWTTPSILRCKNSLFCPILKT